jgi:hypothetical protein
MTTEPRKPRREFLENTKGVALILGFHLPAGGHPGVHDSQVSGLTRGSDHLRQPITVLAEIPEMGQGARTVDTMMLADELEADYPKSRERTRHS